MKTKWTTEEVEILKNNWKNLTNSQLAKLIPNHSRDAISRKLGRIGIKLSKEDISWRMKYAHSFVDFNNICKLDQNLKLEKLNNSTLQILLGSMLGDGSSNKQSKNLRNCRFTEGHGLKQSDYTGNLIF